MLKISHGFNFVSQQSHMLFVSFNFANMAKVCEIAKFNLAKINRRLKYAIEHDKRF